MLGNFNFASVSSAKGMVLVPSIVGSSRSQAVQALTDAKLNYLDLGTVSTSNVALDNTIATQSIVGGSLVEYETEISFTYYVYAVSPTPTPTPVTPTPTPVTPTPTPVDFTVWYGAACCNGNIITASSSASEANVIDYLDANCMTGTITNTTVIQGTYSNPSYPSITCTTTPTPTPTPTPTITTWYGAACCNGSVITASSNAGQSTVIDYLDQNCLTGTITNVSVSTSGYPSITCTTTPTPTPTPTPVTPTPTPTQVCGSGCQNCIDYGGEWNYATGTCTYPSPTPAPTFNVFYFSASPTPSPSPSPFSVFYFWN